MELLDAIQNRRSIRKFTDQSVSQQQIETVLQAARWAPSACNRQLWEFVVVRQPETKTRIARDACFGQKFLINAPVIIAVFYDDTKERHDEDRPAKHDSLQSAAAAIQNMLLATHAQGLGAIWVCAIKHMRKLNEILQVPLTIRPVALVALGHPAETPRPPHRRPFESFVHYERFRQGSATYPNAVTPDRWTLEELSAFRAQVCWFGGAISRDFILERVNMHHPVFQTLMETARRFWPEKGRVLDVLSYAGGFLAGLLDPAERAGQMTAFELNEGNVRFIRENLESLRCSLPEFAVNAGPGLSIPQEGFSLLTCFFRLEKMPDPDALLKEMHDALNPGGRLILATELKGFTRWPKLFFRRNRQLHTSQWWNVGPLAPMTRGEVMRRVRNAGFQIRESRVLREGSFLKSLARQIIRMEGETLLLILSK